MSMALNYPYTISSTGAVEATVVPSKIFLDKVLTLLSTNLGQRPMTPEYGVDWAQALFENEGQAVPAINQAIRTAISLWLPEVSVTDIQITGDSYEGIQKVLLSLRLPDDTVATMALNSGTINYDGIVTR